MKYFIGLMVYILFFGNTIQIYGQVESAMNHPTINQWLIEHRGKYREDPLSDSRLIKILQSRPLAQYLEIGEKEIEIEKFFTKAVHIQGRFDDGTDVGNRKSLHWVWRMTDIIATGKVIEVINNLSFCVYKTDVVVEVDKYLKGNSEDKIKIKLLSGKGRNGKWSMYSDEPSFKVGEKVLVFLTSIPFSMHRTILQYPCSDETNLFYMTKTDGWFELMNGGKYTIENEDVEWLHGKKPFIEIERQIRLGLEDEF